MKRQILIAATLLIGILRVEAQSPNLIQFKEVLAKKDTLAQRQLLQKWEKDAADDPDYYLANLIYLLTKGNKAGGAIANNPDYKKAFASIDKGIEKAPKRLDLRVYKMTFLNQLKENEELTLTAIKTVDDGIKMQNAWVWSDNKPINKAKEGMLTYINQFLNELSARSLTSNVKRISSVVLKYYDNVFEIICQYAGALVQEKQYNSALPYLLQANKLSPNDPVVAMTIGNVYAALGNKEKAITFYQIVTTHGGIMQKLTAQEQILRLKNK